MPCLQKARTLSWRQTAERKSGTSSTAAALSSAAGSLILRPSRSFGCYVSVWKQRMFSYVSHNILVLNCMVCLHRSQSCIIPPLYLWLLSGSWTWALLITSCWTSTFPEGSRSLYTLQRKTKIVLSEKNIRYINLDTLRVKCLDTLKKLNVHVIYFHNYWHCSFTMKASKLHTKMHWIMEETIKVSNILTTFYFEIALKQPPFIKSFFLSY